MLSPDLLQKIQKLYIKSRYLVNDVFSGEYETAFRGRGMEFEEVREYVPGDDIRMIDWNVSARMDQPFVKVFREEREQTLVLLVDLSQSEYFGSQQYLKRDVTTEIAAVLAYAAIKSNDKIGLLIFSDHVERYIPPAKTRGHVWHVISEILSFQPKGTKTNLPRALNYLDQVLSRRAICFVLSDFLAHDFEKSLRVASMKHDLICIHITDPMEYQVSHRGFVTFKDLETQRLQTIDFNSSRVQKAFHIQQKRREEQLRKIFQSIRLDFLFLKTNHDYIKPLLRLFRNREHRH